MSKIAISIGPLSITWYSLCILIGIVLAYILIIRESEKFDIPTSFASNLIFWCVCIGILGARIYYVLFNLDYYISSPIEAIKIWNGGLAIHGGILAGIITLVIYCKKNNVSILKMIDISVPAVILAQAIGRWGNFFNKECHGGIVTKAFLEKLHLPKFIIENMKIGGVYYHPTFLYESILCIMGFLIMIYLRKHIKIKKGTITSFYFVWYGIVRFFIEGLRTDSLMFGSLKAARLVSIAMIIIGIVLFIVTNKKCEYYDNRKEKSHGKKA